MSVHVTSYVWEHSTHKGAELLLMLAIADIAHKNGVAFPSIKTLAGFLRMSDRQVSRLIQRCERSQELEVKRNGGPHGTHLFRIRMNLTLPLFNLQQGDDKLSGDKLSGDKSASGGVTSRASGGDTAMSPEPKELKKNSKETGALRRTSIPDGFEISERVRKWASEKGYTPYLEAHFEHFLGHCRANPARYVDWDEALMNCIRADWGGVRRQAQVAARAPGGVAAVVAKPPTKCRYCQRPSVGSVNGIDHCSSHSADAMDHKPAPQREPA